MTPLEGSDDSADSPLAASLTRGWGAAILSFLAPSLLYAVPYIAAIAGYSAVVDFLALNEDGIYESVGATSCLAAAVLFAFVSRWTFYDRNAGLASRSPWGAAAMATGLFLMYGEEINWGQQVLGFGTPVWVSQRSHVGAFNLHNLNWFYTHQTRDNLLMHLWLAGMVGFMGIGPLVARRFPSLERKWMVTGLPLASPKVAWATFGAVLGFAVALVRWPNRAEAGQQTSEILEATLEGLLFAMACAEVSRFSSGDQPRPVRGAWMAAASLAALSLAVSVWAMARSHVPLTRSVLWVREGQLRLVKGERDPALAAFEKATSLWPKSAAGHFLTGLVYDQSGDLAKAAAGYEKAILAAPNFAEAHANLGLVRHRERRPDAALAHLKLAVESQPSNPDFRNSLGVVLLVMGRRADATTQFKEALRLAPNHADAAKNLAAISSANP